MVEDRQKGRGGHEDICVGDGVRRCVGLMGRENSVKVYGLRRSLV